MTDKRRTGLLLLWAYQAYHEKNCADREQRSWAYLFIWAQAGGKTRDVPTRFGGASHG